MKPSFDFLKRSSVPNTQQPGLTVKKSSIANNQRLTKNTLVKNNQASLKKVSSQPNSIKPKEPSLERALRGFSGSSGSDSPKKPQQFRGRSNSGGDQGRF